MAHPPDRTVREEASWKSYVANLCASAWELDAAATANVVTAIEELAAADRLTDEALIDLLRDAGVPYTAADVIAPSIRVAIQA